MIGTFLALARAGIGDDKDNVVAIMFGNIILLVFCWLTLDIMVSYLGCFEYPDFIPGLVCLQCKYVKCKVEKT